VNGYGTVNNYDEGVPILYPMQYSASLKFYDSKDAEPSRPIWARIDMQSGATQGFAYCQYPPFGLAGSFSNFKTKPRLTLLDQQIVSTRPPSGSDSAGFYSAAEIFERDQYLYMWIDQRH
jgi:hypothetical protein